MRAAPTDGGRRVSPPPALSPEKVGRWHRRRLMDQYAFKALLRRLLTAIRSSRIERG